MIILLSPAKTLDFKSDVKISDMSEPCFLKEANELARFLKGFMPSDLVSIMGISDKLADLNYNRYQEWNTSDNEKKQAVYAFKGDVYTGLEVDNISNIKYLQSHLRILSGLYGYLRPLDIIQPYRLEMGTKLNNLKGKDLYAFWGDKISDRIKKDLQTLNNKFIINLASNEYFNSVSKYIPNDNVITPIFKDYKNGKLKVVSFFAKKARGIMTKYIVDNELKDIESIKVFNGAGYAFDDALSSEREWIFIR